MKKLLLPFLASLLVCLASCSNLDENEFDANIKSGEDTEQFTGDEEITIEFVASLKNKSFSLGYIGKDVKVDWGDGSSSENLTSDREYLVYKEHVYDSVKTYVIKVKTANLEGIALDPSAVHFDKAPKLSSIRFVDGVIDREKGDSINISMCSNVKELSFLNTHLKDLILPESKKLELISLNNSIIELLDVQDFTHLETIGVSQYAYITDIKLKNNLALESFSVEGIFAKTLDFSNSPNLKFIYLYTAPNIESIVLPNNPSQIEALAIYSCPRLRSIDFSKLSGLKQLRYCDTQKTFLDLSACLQLEILNGDWRGEAIAPFDPIPVVTYKKLENIKLPNSPTLREVYLNQHNLSEATLNTIFANLPLIASSETKKGLVDIFDNPGFATCNKGIANQRGWFISERNPQ